MQHMYCEVLVAAHVFVSSIFGSISVLWVMRRLCKRQRLLGRLAGLLEVACGCRESNKAARCDIRPAVSLHVKNVPVKYTP